MTKAVWESAGLRFDKETQHGMRARPHGKNVCSFPESFAQKYLLHGVHGDD